MRGFLSAVDVIARAIAPAEVTGSGQFAFSLFETIGRDEFVGAIADLFPLRDHALAGIGFVSNLNTLGERDIRMREMTGARTQDRAIRCLLSDQREQIQG